MQGDTIIVEEHHRKAAEEIVPMILDTIKAGPGKYTITVAGESGSGKSETATAIAEVLARENIASVIFQQDDYFVFPPKSNDRARREDISWVGPQEVNLALLDRHLQYFLNGNVRTTKPLVIYGEDAIKTEVLDMENAQVAIAEGTYTTLLDNVNTHVFIARNYEDTRAHREKRKRDAAELDPFVDGVLKIEHNIISANKPRAHILISRDYEVSAS